MPSIDAAMVQSLARKRTVLDVLAAAMQPLLYGRDVADVEGKITDVKTAFSSWDNCMDADFCKWPVIAVIIVGGLILLSIIWCIARCACCGLSCCCECFYCLKCCGNCCGCCDPPRGKRNKYLDEPYLPPDQGYRSEAPMAAGAMAAGALPSYKPPVHDAPQYANFDVSKTAGHEDALPPMPSWENASSKKVYLEEEVEMDNLKKPEDTGPTAPLINTNDGSPGPASPSPLNSPSQNGPYGPSRLPAANNFEGGHPAVSNGYLAAGAIPAVAGATAADPYGRGNPGYASPQQTGVADYGAERGTDLGYGASAMGPGRQSPRQYNNQQPGYGTSPPPQQQPQGGYGRNNQAGNYYDDYRGNSNNTPQGYGMDRRSPRIPDVGMGSMGGNGSEYGAGSPAGPGRYASPGPYGPPSSRSPANSRALNNRPPPQRQYSGSATGNRGNTGYSNQNNGTYGASEMPASPTLQNSGGFDFSSGYARAELHGQDEFSNNNSSSNNNYGSGYGSSNNRAMNHSTSPPPLAQPQPDRSRYPGYQAYRG